MSRDERELARLNIPDRDVRESVQHLSRVFRVLGAAAAFAGALFVLWLGGAR